MAKSRGDAHFFSPFHPPACPCTHKTTSTKRWRCKMRRRMPKKKTKGYQLILFFFFPSHVTAIRFNRLRHLFSPLNKENQRRHQFFLYKERNKRVDANNQAELCTAGPLLSTLPLVQHHRCRATSIRRCKRSAASSFFFFFVVYCAAVVVVRQRATTTNILLLGEMSWQETFPPSFYLDAVCIFW